MDEQNNNTAELSRVVSFGQEVHSEKTSEGRLIKLVNGDAVRHEKSAFRRCCETCCPATSFVLGTLFIVLGLLCLKYSVYEFIMEDRLNMKPGMPAYEFWKNPEPEVTFKVCIWNVTNSEEFLSGADDKIRLQEVGPITYLEVLSHSDVVFNENSTLSYTASKKVYFMEDRNVPGILNQTVIVPNLATLGLASYLEDAGFVFNLGASMMIRQANEQAFRKMTVYDYFWNYTSDVLVWAKTLGGTMLVPTENMGVLHNIYSDFSDRLNVKIGKTHGADKFFFLNSYNYATTVPGFQTERGDCNATILDSTEGAIYPQNLTKTTELLYWRKTLCRPAKLHFEEEVRKGPLLGYKFVLPNDVFDRQNDTEDCYKGVHTLPDGLSDLSKCFFKFPVAASKPHFYGRQGKWTEHLEGLQPQRELHDSYIIAEPKMGVPIDQCARSQSNLVVSDRMSGMYSADLKKFQGMILPMFWLEYHQKELTPIIVFVVDFTVNKLPKVEGYIGPVLLMFGLSLIGYVAFIIFRWYRARALKLVINEKQ